MPWAGDLSKRTPGTPLSEAELQQRRDAAKSRWERAAGSAGAALGGAAVGAVAANQEARRRQRAGWAEIRRAKASTVDAERARHDKVISRMDAVRAAGERRISRGGWPVPLYRTVKQHEIRTAERAIARLPGEFLGFDDDGRPAIAPYDQERLNELFGRIEHARGEVDRLADAVPPRRVMRAGGEVKVPKVHPRTLKIHRPPDPAAVQRAEARVDLYRKLLDEARAADDMSDDAWDAISRTERLVARAERRLERVRRGPTETRSITVGASRSAEEAERTITRAPTKQRIQGKPDAKGLARIRDTLKAELRDWHYPRTSREFVRHREQLAAARSLLRERVALALRRMPTRKGRFAAIAAGALGGGATGLAGLTLAETWQRRRVEKMLGAEGLRKVDDLGRDPAEDLLAAGEEAEQTMGERLAATFRRLREAPTGKLLRGEEAIVGELTTGLRSAVAPLAQAMARGAGTTPVAAEVTPDDAMSVVFSFDARNPNVEAYIRQFRDQRVRELAEEQADTIRAIMAETAATGASPQATARRIREAIGLTSGQAAQVQRFREQLQQLDPAALQRALRDRRFDRTVAGAIATGVPLSDEQVDRMVEAYHRRYLAYRATTIARTEGVGAANNGHVAALKAWLAENPNYTVVKTWMATADERTRPDHRHLHGQVVTDIDTPFRCENGDTIRWPGDQDAPARQVINCRCTISTRIVPRVRTVDTNQLRERYA
jgi:hypothetical protein